MGMITVVRRMITDVDYISLTTDIWSTEISNDSLLSLTAHWVTNDFEKRSCVLNARQPVESHMGEYISQVFTDMLAAGAVPTDKIHLVLRDNGANMIKAIQGVQTMKLEMLHTLKRRFCDVETNEALILGTILDPRFKDKFFTSVSARQGVAGTESS